MTIDEFNEKLNQYELRERFTKHEGIISIYKLIDELGPVGRAIMIIKIIAVARGDMRKKLLAAFGMYKQLAKIIRSELSK